MLTRIEVASNLKVIVEDDTLRSGLFKLVLYLLNQVHCVMKETDWQQQCKLLPDLGKYDLELKSYGNPKLLEQVNRYIIKEGNFMIEMIYNDGCHEIRDSDD